MMLSPFKPDPDAAPDASRHAACPPFLFKVSKVDPLGLHSESVDMMNALRKAGAQADIIEVPDAPHAFFNSPQWFMPTIDDMAAFFGTTLGKGTK